MLPLRTLLILVVPLIFGAAATAQGTRHVGYDDRDVPAAIALFSRTGFGGEVREAFDPFASMHDLRFNDAARSVAVLAGQWELCEHKDFTGRCVFIREDVADLGWFGLDRRVSSVRPIYEYTEAEHGLLFTRDRYGYIRYAHDEWYGSDTFLYGYASTSRLDIYHYGYSPLYWRYGYYSPSWGYDPYGFAYGPRGHLKYYGRAYGRHPRPYRHSLNPYWVSHPSWDIWSDHWSDDWRDDRRHDRRRGPRRDGHPDGTGTGGTGTGAVVVADPVPVNPRRGGGRGTDPVLPGPGRALPDPVLPTGPLPDITGLPDLDPPDDDGLTGGPVADPGGYRPGRGFGPGSTRGGRGNDDWRSGGDFTPPATPVFTPPPAPVYTPQPAYDPPPQPDWRPGRNGDDEGGSGNGWRGGRREGSAED